MIKTENFVISFEGREYKCLREIKSGEVTTQKAFVEDIGIKDDSHLFSAEQIYSMEAAGKLWILSENTIRAGPFPSHRGVKR
jgi:hypothetical protein